MADNSNGLMYGVAEVKFKESQGEEKTLGWLDENGMQPAGNAPPWTPSRQTRAAMPSP